MSEIKLIVGLGNPGKEYEKTRHNAGFLVLDSLAESDGFSFRSWKGVADVADHSFVGEKIFFAKPSVYMNNSGIAVKALSDFHKIPANKILLIFDDFSLPLGKIRFRKSGSAGGHNGISSVIEHLGADMFSRLRLGIGPIPPLANPSDFVLGKFGLSENEMVKEMIERACGFVRMCLSTGIDAASNKLQGDSSKETVKKSDKL
jgi:PTH1 family peptidyl-tRNA hydrolase